MTTRQLNFKGPPQLAIAAGAQSPDPGITGVQIWSTITNSILVWNGGQWEAIGGGGGAGLNYGAATLDFGTHPGQNEAQVTIQGLTTISGTSNINIWVQQTDSTTNHTVNDHRYFSAMCSFSPAAVTAGVGFIIHATSIHKLSGQFKVRYSWS